MARLAVGEALRNLVWAKVNSGRLCGAQGKRDGANNGGAREVRRTEEMRRAVVAKAEAALGVQGKPDGATNGAVSPSAQMRCKVTAATGDGRLTQWRRASEVRRRESKLAWLERLGQATTMVETRLAGAARLRVSHKPEPCKLGVGKILQPTNRGL
ncbi:hypothetical protein U1Q18_028132 [Sarracenia purpurea var. burkii]